MSLNYLVRVCAKCRKPVGELWNPCSHCGYKHPLTEAGKEWALKKALEEVGYELIKVTHCKNHDRINYQNDEIKLSLKLRKKLKETDIYALIYELVSDS